MLEIEVHVTEGRCFTIAVEQLRFGLEGLEWLKNPNIDSINVTMRNNVDVNDCCACRNGGEFDLYEGDDEGLNAGIHTAKRCFLIPPVWQAISEVIYHPDLLDIDIYCEGFRLHKQCTCDSNFLDALRAIKLEEEDN